MVNTAIVRLALFLLLGIYTGFRFFPPLFLLYLLLAGTFLLFGICYLRANKQLVQDKFFGSSCLLLFFLLGFGSVQLHRPQNQQSHYSNLLETGNSSLVACISAVLKPSRYQKKYLAEVRQIAGKKSFGRVLLLLPEQSPGLQAGDLVVFPSSLEPIPTSLNPQQFDYRGFMENRGILYQASPSEKEVLLLDGPQGGFAGTIEGIHTRILKKLGQHSFGKEELAIVQALWLGQRREISPETYENFVDAGVVHILAVSGLHVGLLLLILNFLFSPLDASRPGKFLKVLLVLLLLWAYALMAGFSPSVVRAVSMFSFVAVGLQLKRQTSVLNSLFLSLMLLLLARPQWLFEVGFQLSYLAVFAIVLLQPRIAPLFHPRNRILKYLWSLLTVTLAAQIGVMPLSLFYFHQFPGLFFLSNLLILPLLGILMGFGILVICLGLLNTLPDFLAETLNLSIRLLNELVALVAAREEFVFKDIPFSLPWLFSIYSLLLLFFLSERTLFSQKIKLLLGGLILLQGVVLYEASSGSEKELVIFHKNRHTVIAERQKKHLKLAHNLGEVPEQQVFLKNYWIKNRISSVQPDVLKNVYEQEDGLLLVIDSSGIYRIPGLRPNRILLRNSPRINLERLLLELQPEEVIADGSNYISYIKRWEASCRELNFPFHNTGEKGAYLVSSPGRARLQFTKKPSEKKNPFRRVVKREDILF